MNEFQMPTLGEKFPEMEVKTTHGMMKLPDAYAGKWFVLFSHPGDFTPVCTTEFVEFQNMAAEFKAVNCELIGASVDQVFSNIKWVDWIEEKLGVKIEFPVIADELGRVAGRLGMIHSGKGTNTVRAVFIVDDKGTVRIVLYYPQEIGRNIDEVLRAVKALQKSDKDGVATPANWPNNKVLADRVIVPPAPDEKTKAARLASAEKGEIECYDWWFCHKSK
jgi:peroxiredoxin (alkyl hydroperoxide reductase subunit C)